MTMLCPCCGHTLRWMTFVDGEVAHFMCPDCCHDTGILSADPIKIEAGQQ